MAGQVDASRDRCGGARRAACGSPQSTVALTGAGISVPSGIPDFRTPGDGAVDEGRPDEGRPHRRLPPRHGGVLGATTARASRCSATSGRTRPTRRSPSSSAAGCWTAVVTQNIDRLHRAAGSERVIEVHGSIATSSCTTCGCTYALEEVEDALRRGRGRDLQRLHGQGQARRRPLRRVLPEARWPRPRSSAPAPSCCCASARRSRSIRSRACPS